MTVATANQMTSPRVSKRKSSPLWNMSVVRRLPTARLTGAAAIAASVQLTSAMNRFRRDFLSAYVSRG